jgi:DNA-directed RNA polymerase subunit RPC12/RpoP
MAQLSSSSKLACPTCGSNRLRHSHQTSFTDKLRGLIGQRPYRCRSCQLRFYEKVQAIPLTREEIRLQQKEQLTRTLIAVALTSVLGLGLLIPYFSSKPPIEQLAPLQQP